MIFRPMRHKPAVANAYCGVIATLDDAGKRRTFGLPESVLCEMSEGLKFRGPIPTAARYDPRESSNSVLEIKRARHCFPVYSV